MNFKKGVMCMQMGYGLIQEQALKLVMTPELRQAITILQFSALDLVEYINQQMSENPVIEAAGKMQPEGDFWKEYWRDRSLNRINYSSQSNESESNPLDWIAKNDVTLEKHLLEQLAYLRKVPARTIRVAKFIIGNLDDRGYLELAPAQIAGTLQEEVEEVEQALFLVQSLEPHGVGARNLKECLLIQLEYAGKRNTLAYKIVEDYLDLLAEGKISRIATKLEITPKEVQTAVDSIRLLRPRPGSLYHRDEPRYIIPDVTVENVAGDFVILLNDAATPRLSINSYYEKVSQQYEEAKKYIHEKMNSAMWLLKSIEQRRMTIYKVTEAIVREQRDFLEKGISYLKPMTLKEIADKVGLHESTISRATNNKYVQTPRGVFELKYFFSSALTTTGGDSTSSESVKAQIKALVEQEDRKVPLSDQKLMDILKEKGVFISRRTVAKYREEIGIPSSAKRKRY
jgi:RNA polymerase sigma-54 factor